MHIAPYDNQNRPIVDADSPTVPLNYFNIVKLKRGDAFEYQVPGYETCIVPATGTIDVDAQRVFKFSVAGPLCSERSDGLAALAINSNFAVNAVDNIDSAVI